MNEWNVITWFWFSLNAFMFYVFVFFVVGEISLSKRMGGIFGGDK